MRYIPKGHSGHEHEHESRFNIWFGCWQDINGHWHWHKLYSLPIDSQSLIEGACGGHWHEQSSNICEYGIVSKYWFKHSNPGAPIPWHSHWHVS